MYRGRQFQREQVYVCGDYIDADVYPVFQPAGKRRSRCRPTSDIQQKLNQRNAEKKLTRLVHLNFGPEDLALHLTYADGAEPLDEEDAARLLSNFIRRLKRLYKKLGIELKYISCTEYGKKSGRVHHHMILSGGADRDLIERAWGRGYANTKRLQFSDDGVTGLAHYMAKDHRFFRRWNGSRNLLQPEPAVFDGKLSAADVGEICDAIDRRCAHAWFERRYPEWVLTEAWYEQNPINRGLYVHYAMRRRREARMCQR